MTQILDNLPADCTDRILCCYINDTHRIKIARITHSSNWHFERIVFPREKLCFEAIPEALVEITSCDRLAVKDSQTDQTCIAQWRENFADEPDKSFNIAEKFMNK